MPSKDKDFNTLHEETDLIGFDSLWDADFNQVKDFISSKQKNIGNNNYTELDLLSKELDDKNFELQKLNWQLTERERELKNLYEELHRMLELNKKLNNQLQDFERLAEKQEALMQMINHNPYKNKEPILPTFGR
jgi:septal ring factor EnvC (AmiA/AmiB activator)